MPVGKGKEGRPYLQQAERSLSLCFAFVLALGAAQGACSQAAPQRPQDRICRERVATVHTRQLLPLVLSAAPVELWSQVERTG